MTKRKKEGTMKQQSSLINYHFANISDMKGIETGGNLVE